MCSLQIYSQVIREICTRIDINLNYLKVNKEQNLTSSWELHCPDLLYTCSNYVNNYIGSTPRLLRLNIAETYESEGYFSH